jgi:hypothetical protein
MKTIDLDYLTDENVNELLTLNTFKVIGITYFDYFDYHNLLIKNGYKIKETKYTNNGNTFYTVYEK